jgi:hypothetical protein
VTNEPFEAPPPITGLASTPGGGWVPVPDPTTLTTQQLRRELAGTREFLELQINALKELTDMRFTAAAEAVAAALAAAEKAVEKAETASEKRFDGVNEFRKALSDQALNLLTRKEYETAHEALVARVSLTEDRLAKLPGRDEVEVKVGAGKAVSDQQEQRLRDIEKRLAASGGADAATDAGHEDYQRGAANRILALGVALSVVVIVVNVVIALIAHHA